MFGCVVLRSCAQRGDESVAQATFLAAPLPSPPLSIGCVEIPTSVRESLLLLGYFARMNESYQSKKSDDEDRGFVTCSTDNDIIKR